MPASRPSRATPSSAAESDATAQGVRSSSAALPGSSQSMTHALNTMEILLNGKPLALDAPATLADAVAAAQIPPPFAAALNGRFVPRAAHADTPLSAGDRIDLVQPVTGG